MVSLIDQKLVDIEVMTRDLKTDLHSNPSNNNFISCVSFTQEVSKYLYKGNDERLIKLMIYDLYSLLFNSKKDIKAAYSYYGDDYCELLDMNISHDDTSDAQIYGDLTRFFLDPHPKNTKELDKYTYFGSLNVFYVEDGIGTFTREFRFNKTGLLIITNLNGIRFFEDIYVNKNGLIAYKLKSTSINEGKVFFKADESNVKSKLEKYCDKLGSDYLKLLFPELYKTEYFKEYNVPQRIK